MWQLRPLIIQGLLLALVASAASNGQTPKKQESELEKGRRFLGLAPPADPVAAARGQKLFVQNCGFCHGPNATGAEGPDLLRSSIVLHDQKGETIAPVVHNGRPEKGMPSFAGLTEPQIYDIAEFLHQRVEDAANRFGYKLQNIVTGNAEAGKAFFYGAGHCDNCHSPSGDLAHIGSKLEPVDLQAEFLYPSEALTTESAKAKLAPQATVTLSSGQTITGALKRIDDFDVSIIDATGAVKSWPLKDIKLKIDDPLTAHRELLAKYTDADMHNLLAYLVTLK